MATAAVVALLFLTLRFVAGDQTYDVLGYGAIGDGKSNDAQAFLKAWEGACADSNYPSIVIPAGRTFLLTQVKFKGPCKSWISVKVDGNIIAPNYMWTKEATDLIAFQDVDGVTVAGNGEIDGNGAAWWDCVRNKGSGCQNRPNLLVFMWCKSVRVMGLRMKNGPTKHLKIINSVGVHVSGVEVRAPRDSPNTDALHIAGSQFVEFTDCNVGIGDDCVAIGPGSSDINITHITCGPGHGLSIGSLGPNSKVERVRISDSHVSDATTGVKIKTWEGGSGNAKQIYFERVNFTAVRIPIVIDQYYCPSHQCKPQSTSNVAISDIRFVDLYGTSSEKEAISIQCSKQIPCTNILMGNINIRHQDGSRAESNCANAYGRTVGEVVPKCSLL